MNRQHDYFCARTILANQRGRFQSCHFRHIDVQENHIRFQLLAFLDRFPPVGGLPDDRNRGIAQQTGPNALADERMIVGQKQLKPRAFHRPRRLWFAGEPDNGIRAVTVAPRPPDDAISRVPPRSAARSLMLRKPQPVLRDAAIPLPLSRITKVAISPERFKRTWTRVARACFSTLFNASCAIR